MPCIFGFGFHEEFCPCDLVNVKKSKVDELICQQCDYMLHREYYSFLKDPKIKDWDGDYQDFLRVFIEDRLKILEYQFYENYECDLSDKEYELADVKFQRMCDIYFENEEKRFGAKIESGQISIE